MKTVVMKRSDREKKNAAENYGRHYQPEAEDYHHGLVINLDDDCLRKLGINQMPKPGDHFRIEGEAHVTSAEQRDTDQNSDRRVGLVLHKLGAEKTDAEEQPKEKSIREELEDAHHRARGSTAPSIGAARRSNGTPPLPARYQG
jgi:hypothetical protein